MERIISYSEIPFSHGETIYIDSETDPELYVTLLSKGYKIISHIFDATEDTIYVTRRKQDIKFKSFEEFKTNLDNSIYDNLANGGISRPKTYSFSFDDLLEHKYKLPFVLKNENINCGREKFLIKTEEDYQNLIMACEVLINRNMVLLLSNGRKGSKYDLDYNKYLNLNFSVQEYIETPSEYNTTVRLLTSASDDLLYASLKYNKPVPYFDDTSLLGYLLTRVYPLSSLSIVSNTAVGGENILIGENHYSLLESKLLKEHNIDSDIFNNLIQSAQCAHVKNKSELGIICGFDFIYDKEKEKWYFLEYHTKPMLGDYSRRQNIRYITPEDRLIANGRVRATALSLTLKKD